MPPGNRASLWNALSAANLAGRFFAGAHGTVPLSGIFEGSCLGGRTEELDGRSVLIVTTDPLAAALAAIELDGIARRLVLYPADLALEHVPYVMASVPADAIVSDRSALGVEHPAVGSYVRCSANFVPGSFVRRAQQPTEWILLTSGTTGRPKMVAHTLAGLTGAIDAGNTPASRVVWSTFYDIRRYGGLQIFLRAVFTRASLVLTSTTEPTAQFLTRAGAYGVTHISGTPSHWRRALMSPYARKIEPQYVRLSGEIADQGILDNLRAFYPQAKIAHAFASTEAGVAFDVGDGQAGFPASLIDERSGDVEMKVEGGSLCIRSPRTAARYIGPNAPTLADADGFVDTGDMVELRGDRYYFVGRRDGVINVGGQKVHPEEVEGVINRHPNVRMSLVRPRKNPLTGALVVADVVLEDGADAANGRAAKLADEILQLCRCVLARYKVPASIHFVNELAVAATGKIVRRDA
jgi:acyl-coenzyme A synthetase/AMP-(fatty) acid ligase